MKACAMNAKSSIVQKFPLLLYGLKFASKPQQMFSIHIVGVPNKYLLFEISPKFDYQALSKIFFLFSFVNDPKTYGDDKMFVCTK